MLLRPLKYFVKVVELHSFSEAAAELYISQSAISQQIQALERDLGFKLLERQHRSFELTAAGEYFYRKAVIMLTDFERTCREANRLADANAAALTIGYLRSYCGSELQLALQGFGEKYPHVSVHFTPGNHEELYQMLRTETADLVLNDQRRAFSDEYNNLILATRPCCVVVSSKSPLARLKRITPQELKTFCCILVSTKQEQDAEHAYYYDVVGLHGEYLYAETLEEARLLVVSGKGFLPLEGDPSYINFGNTIASIPLCRSNSQLTRNYCAFWKRNNSGHYVEAFVELLKNEFAKN